MDPAGLAPSEALEATELSAEELRKRPFYVYDKDSEETFSQILNVLSFQSVIGIATVFDGQSARSGLRNLTYFVVVAESPAVTYLFNCFAVDAKILFLGLRRLLQNPKVTKVVHAVDPAVSYIYQRQFIEMPNVVALQQVDRNLRRIKEDTWLSVEEMVRLYVNRSFKDPLPVEEGSIGSDDRTYNSTQLAQQAAMQGAYLLDIFRSQQQLRLEPIVERLGAKVRKNMQNVVHSHRHERKNRAKNETKETDTGSPS